MEDTSKVHLENLKRCVMVSIAAILTFLGSFRFFVMEVPLVQCVLEWLFGLSICLVVLHVSFHYIFRIQDQTTRNLNQMKMLHEVGKTINHQRLVEGIRAIARGEMLLSPTVAARVVQQLARTRQEKEREADALQALTPREREVFRLVAQGCTNAEIAERLVLSEKTVKTHVCNISNKLNLSGKGEMRVLAAQLGLVPEE